MNLDEVEAMMNRVKRREGGNSRQTIVPGDGDHRHGTTNGYGNLGCRCPECTEAHRITHLKYTHRTGRNLPREEYNKKLRENPPPHGTTSRYSNPWRCRCKLCKFASSVARASRRQ